MGCKKATVRFAKETWKVLGPVLAPHVTKMVGLVEELGDALPDLITSNHDRRRLVIESTLKKAKEIGHDAFNAAKPVTVGALEGAIRTQIQRSLHLLREQAGEATGAWSEIDDASDEAEAVTI